MARRRGLRFTRKKKSSKTVKQAIVETVQVEYSESQTPEIASKIRHNASSAINRLPVEIFSMIILMTRTSSNPLLDSVPGLYGPYPQLVLSWVCHRWRTYILQEPSHWKDIIIGPRMMRLCFLQAFVIRSRPVKLDILLLMGYQQNWKKMRYRLTRAFIRDGVRVRTLITERERNWPFFKSVFPQLENLFYAKHANGPDFDTVVSQYPLKTLQTCSSNLTEISKSPSRLLALLNLQCLRLGSYQVDQITLVSILSGLQQLPRLRTLHIRCTSTKPVLVTAITLKYPNLTTLILYEFSILVCFEAPKLSYLNVYRHMMPPAQAVQDYSRFYNFDMSAVTWMSVAVDPFPEPYLSGGKNLKDVGDTNTEKQDTARDAQDWLNGYSFFYGGQVPTSYPTDRFHLSFEDLGRRSPDVSLFMEKLLDLCLNKTVNLVELTFDYFYASFPTRERMDRFIRCLREAVTIRTLIILEGNDFGAVSLCLHDGTVCPRMENLVYQNHKASKDDARSVLPCLIDLTKQRSLAGTSPLKTVELRNFERLEHETVQEIEKLGLKLIQSRFKKN